MFKRLHTFFFLLMVVFVVATGCNDQTGQAKKSGDTAMREETPGSKAKDYTEGKDYTIYERVRLLDKQGFTEPQEAHSLLLPKGWITESAVIWNAPGGDCAGTYRQLAATSADGKYSFEMFLSVNYSWSTDPQLQQFHQNNRSTSPFCAQRPPMDAEQYLRTVFAEELGNPEIVKIEPNGDVVAQMQQASEAGMRELQQYGAGDMQIHPTAINAVVRWPNGTEGLVLLGVTVLEMVVPNVYNGSYAKSLNTSVATRIVYKYPGGEHEEAKNSFSVLMGSMRTNPAWNNAVNNFWKEARQQSHTVHVGKIKMMDEQTRRIGEQAIRSGQERLKAMDLDIRSWEQQQSAQDRMHTAFVKTIREVENYRDETGTYEMTSSYSHAWSRGDGTTFVMSNNPNFDPAFVFQDQNWKAMQKVE